MDPVEPGAGIAPRDTPAACRVAMLSQPRVKTLQELLRRTTKISKAQTSPVLTEGARMRGPGVKEECYNCRGFVVDGELQKCSTCDRGFHASCLNKPVNTVASGEVWCCGLCDDSESLEDDTQAVDGTPGDSMTSSQTTSSLRKASTSAGKKKTTNIRGLKEVVQQEEANLFDSRLLPTDSHEGKAPQEDSVIVNQTVNAAGSDTSKSNIAGIGLKIPAELLDENKRSKRGRLLKSTGHVLPYKRRRADYGTSKAKPSSSSATLSTKEGVDSESKDGKDAEEECFLTNDTSASVLQQADVEEPAVESLRDHDGASSCFVSVHHLGNAENAPVKSPDAAAAVCTTVKRDDDDFEVGVHGNRTSSTNASRKDVSGSHSLDKSETKISKDCAGESDPQVGVVEAPETTVLGLGMQSERFLASKDKGGLGSSMRITDAAKLDILVPNTHDADNKQLVVSDSGSHLDVAASPCASEVVVISQVLNAGDASATRQELCNGVEAASPRSTEAKKVHTHINKEIGKKHDSQLDKRDKLVLGNVADAVSEDSGSLHNNGTSCAPEDTMGKSGEAMEMDAWNEQFPPSTRMHETILHNEPISRLKGQQKLVGISSTECNDSIAVLQSELANERQIDINECLSSEREDEMQAITTPIREPLCNNSNFLDGIHASTGNGTAEPTSLSLPSSPLSPNSNPSTPKLPQTPVASPFIGFPAESTSVKAITPSVTPQFPKHALEQGRGEGNTKASSVGKPLFRVATPPPHTSTLHEKSVISTPPSLLSEECLGLGPVVQESCVDPGASTSVTSVISEDLDPQLSNLVSGLPVPLPRIVQELQPSVPVIEVNAIVAEPIRKPRARIGDSSPSPLVSALSGTKELARMSSIQGPESAGKVSSRLLVNERSRMERENTPPMDVKESSLEDGDESPNSLLVEDVKVCDICGNAGYEEMLAICCSCSEGAEHIYCMRRQMDSLPDFDWFCETCLLKQKQGGSKTGERLVAPSSTLGRSTSFSSRSKSLSAQGGSRSRLTDRLNHKKPRNAPVRKSPLKAPTVQTTVKRLATDSPPYPMAKKMVVESSSGALSSVPSPAVSPQVTNSTVRPLLTRENTFKSSPDTGKVKFLAPSAVASFSGARANAAKSATLASQSLKAGTLSAGQANSKSRFVSLSSISESSPPSQSNKATNSSSSRPPHTFSPTPVLGKSSSGKFSADLPSFLLNSNSRQGNNMKVGSGQAKSSRDASVSDAPVCPPHSKEALGPGAQSSGSKSNVTSMVRLGRNMSIGGSPVEPRSVADSPCPLDNGRSSQRTASPSMPGAGPAPESSKLVTRDGPSPKPEQVGGFGAATGRGSSTDPCSLPGFLGKQSKSANVWSAPWLGASNNTRCATCKGVGHSTQDCPSRTSSPLLEQKVTTAGLSISPNISPGVTGILKDAVPTFSDIDAHVPVVDVETVPTEKVSSGSSNLAFQQSGKDLAPQAAAPLNKSIIDFSKNVAAAPAVMMDTMPKHSASFKIHNTVSSTGSKVPSLLNSNSFRQLVSGQQSAADDGLPPLNGDALMNRLGAKMPLQSSGISTTPSRSYGMEGPPGVPGIEGCNYEFVQNADVVGASAKQIDGLMRCAPKVAQGPKMESPDAGIQLPPPPLLMPLPSRPMWGPRPPWMDGPPPGPPLPVSGPPGPGPGPGAVGYPGPGMGFPPSGNLMYGHHVPMPYMTPPPPPPPPLQPPYVPTPPPPPAPPPAPPPPPPPQSPVPPATPTAVPNDAIAWRGAFEVFDGQTTVVFDEILAHVSTRAVAKVHEVATGLPQRLCLEQVERSLELETWPRQFNARPPTDGSIALYFFATNGESFERFRHKLVDHMVNHDLVLRTQVDDAELLIFPSSKLLEQFQRWHGHMFLWGVFRARKATVPPVVAAASIEPSETRPGPIPRPPAADLELKPKLLEISNMECENTGEMDMEVDMEGGKECGVADKAVKRLESVNNRSPTPTAPAGTVTIKAAATSPNSAVTASQLSCAGSGSISQGKVKNIAKVDLDLPPGFAHTWKDSSNSQTLATVSTPISTLVLNPVPSPAPVLTSNHMCLPVPVPGLTLPPGFEKKIEALKQVGAGSNGDAEAGEGGSSVLKRALSSKDGTKAAISTWQPSPKPAPSPRENEISLPTSTRPLVTRTSRSTSKSPSRRKDVVDRDTVRERLDDRVKERQRRDRELKHGHDKSRDRGRESHRDRGDRERDRRRERDRPRTRDRSRERVRSRERERERDRDRDRDRDREREREKGRNRERLLENRDKSRKHRSRDSDKELNSSRPRYSNRRSWSCSRSRSPARRKVRSRSPGRRKARSRSPVRQRTQSPPSPQRRYSSYRQRTRSVSDSLDTMSEASQGAPTPATRSWREDGDSLQGKRRSGLDKDAGDKSSRPTSRPKARPMPRVVDDTRSESAGASNSRIVATKMKTVPVSSSVTPVLDMNEGVSGAFSGEGAVASTSIPDLNTQNESVESGVLFHDFLPADDSGPSTNLGTANPIPEQPLFPGPRCTGTLSPSIRASLGQDRADPSSFSAVARVITLPEYTASSSAGYQFIKTSETEVDDTVDNPNPDLELALGGRERTVELVKPLPLFVQLRDVPALHSSSPDLAFGLHANSPDLRVGLSTPHSQGSGIGAGAGTASLSLSLAVPQYRKEGNSWVQVEDDHQCSLGLDDVDFALTL